MAVSEPFDSSPEEQHTKAVFVATFGMLAKLANCDGNTSTDEVRLIDTFMRETLGLDEERRKFAIYIFNQSRKSERAFSDFAKDYKALLKDNKKMFEWMISVLLDVSAADQEYSEKEQELLILARDIFEVPIERFEALHDERGLRQTAINEASPLAETKASAEQTSSISDENSPYRVLRVSEAVSNEELQTAYKTLCAQYNPSRIIELDLPQEFVDLAEEKLAEILSAYKSIRAQRGL